MKIPKHFPVMKAGRQWAIQVPIHTAKQIGLGHLARTSQRVSNVSVLLPMPTLTHCVVWAARHDAQITYKRQIVYAETSVGPASRTIKLTEQGVQAAALAKAELCAESETHHESVA
jgi:hypothetical protein